MKNTDVPYQRMLRVAVAVMAFVPMLGATSTTLRPGVTAGQIELAQGELRELVIDDGLAVCAVGPLAKGSPGFGWVNKLTPPSYPATLRAITIGFERVLTNTGVKPDDLYRIVAFVDPENDGPAANQQPEVAFSGRVRGTNEVMTFNLINPLTIASGSFVVGAIDDSGIAGLPALFDTPGLSTPPGADSFFTFTGGVNWLRSADSTFNGPPPCNIPGSFMIRATVELGTVDAFTVSKIKDPLAVEPWGAGVLGTEAFVTNLVSDNVTVINTASVSNTLRNVQLVDPRQCILPGCGPPLGPYGVVGVPGTNKVFVTLFGSNTLPSKEFPIDYSTVLPGRVTVLTRQSDGSFTQSLIGGIGKGPRFPALASGKLYVPCGGDNRVDVISTSTNQKVAEIAVGLDPSSCAASLNESKIYVTNFGDGSVSVIDTKTDKKIKDVAAATIVFQTPFGSTVPPAMATASLPWNGTVSPANGNLYVTYWGTVGNVTPNGVIAELDTCKDQFIRAIVDPETRGTQPGSAGSTGIAAPTAPLTRDPVTGRTLEAGGGGGGPFGIAACLANTFNTQPTTIAFTNDALGIAGILDARIDQVVTAPPIALASCPKPRGVVCLTVNPFSGGTITRATHFAYIACGQPDNSVFIFRVPELPSNIQTIPVIESSEVVDVVRVVGSGFVNPGTRFELARPGTSTCLTFNKNPKFKKNGRVVVQKGSLSDGTSLGDAVNQNAVIRLVNPDGTVIVVRR